MVAIYFEHVDPFCINKINLGIYYPFILSADINSPILMYIILN